MNEREIFLSALDIDDLAARQVHVETACAGDSELLARVKSLLCLNDSPSQFLESPVVAQLAGESSGDRDRTMLVGSGSTQDDEPGLTVPPLSGPATVSEKPNGWKDEAPLGYLQPSSKPGSLGRLAHYEVLEVIGRGAFGTVLRAFDEKLHRVVAIKVMAQELATTSPARKRFIREAQASAAIRHENVVSIYAVEESSIPPYLVMEYIPGKTLQQRLDEQGPLAVLDVLRIGKQIAEGLAAAHAQDLIHRDIKPANILLESGAREIVKVTDFGLARAADDASVTQSGTITGTPMYMAPEQALGLKLDHRADLFSLGSVLYQMVSGRPPFRANGTLAVLKRVTEDTPRPIREIIPEVPQWLCDIISRLHAKNPAERYGSAREVADLLGHCLTELQQARVPAGVAPAGEGGASPAVSAGSPASPRRLQRRLYSAVGLILLAGLAVTLGLLNTETSTLVLEIKDAEATIHVDGRQIATRGIGILTELEIRPGEHHLDVWKDGTLIQHQRFQIGNGGRIGFVIAPKPSEEPNRPAAAIVADNSQGSSPVDSAAGSQAREVLPAIADDWVTLFNGKDLAGWETVPGEPGNWHIEEGLLTGSGRPGYLFTQRDDFTNFQLRCEVRINARGDGGIIVRAPFELPTKNGLPGYEAQIQAGPPILSGWQTGAIGSSDSSRGWRMLQKSAIDLAPETWVTLEVIAMGGSIETRLDGQAIALHTDPQQKYQGGRIALQQSAAGTRIQFRKIEVRLPVVNPPVVNPPAVAPGPAIAPFDTVQAQAHQQAWATHLGLPAEYTNSIGMTFRLIPPGEFAMGDTAAETEAALKEADPNDRHWQECIKSAAPQHRVILTQPFYLGAYEVTQAEYEKVMGSNPSCFATTGTGKEVVAGIDTSRHPAEMVSWSDVTEFCAKLSVLENLRPLYSRNGSTITSLDGTGYRLPTEAEWEYSCRAGTTTKYWIGNGDDTLVQAGWFAAKSGTHPVGALAANPFGLFDIHGNVWEWVEDGWDSSAYVPFQDKPAVNPRHSFTTTSQRLLRGGAWDGDASYCRSASRFANASTATDDGIGFRVLLPVEAVKAVKP